MAKIPLFFYSKKIYINIAIFIFILFSLIFLFKYGFISSSIDQDYSTYQIEGAKYQKGFLSFLSEPLSYPKLLWKAIVICYANLTNSIEGEILNLDNFRLILASLLLITIVFHRNKTNFFLPIITIFTIISFKPFSLLITEWLRQSLSISFFFLYLKYRFYSKKMRNHISLTFGILSFLTHLSIFPSFLICETLKKSKKSFLDFYYKFSIFFLIFPLILVFTSFNTGNEISKLLLILFCFIIMIFYKLKKDFLNFYLASSLILPFTLYPVLVIDGGITQRCFGVISTIGILFVYDFIVIFLNSNFK